MKGAAEPIREMLCDTASPDRAPTLRDETTYPVQLCRTNLEGCGFPGITAFRLRLSDPHHVAIPGQGG